MLMMMIMIIINNTNDKNNNNNHFPYNRFPADDELGGGQVIQLDKQVTARCKAWARAKA